MTDTLQTLIAQLQQPDSNARSQAALALAQADDPRALDALLDALARETDVMVREDVTWALGRKGTSAVPRLIALLGHDSPDVRHNAAHALGKLADARAVDALSDVLRDESDMRVLLKSLLALGQIRDSRAAPAVARLIGHDDPDVQAMVNNVLEQFGPGAVPPTLAALNDEQPQVREHAAHILGLLGEDAAVPALATALTDAHWEVRFAAATALAEIGTPAARAAFQAALNDADARVRQLAQALAKRMKV